jgi:hypothetical protein
VAGKYVDSWGSDEASDCIECPVGTFLNRTGGVVRSDCAHCAYGQFQGSTGSPLCIACPSGQFTSITTVLTECSDCVEGRYQPDVGSNACLDCTAGQYQGATGVTSCIDCDATKYDHDSDPTTPCQNCPVGLTSEPGSFECHGESCLYNLTMPHSSTDCSTTGEEYFATTGEECMFECDQGYSAVRPRMCMSSREFLGGQCSPNSCSEGLTIGNSSVWCQGVTEQPCQFICDCGYIPEGSHICNTDGAFTGGACTACPVGQVGRGISCSICADGHEPSATGCDCVPCEPGYAGLSGICAPCSPGSQPNLAHDACENCPTGRRSIAGIVCNSCPSANEYTDDGETCVAAEDGMQPSADGSSQQACPAGSTGTGGVCERCVAGKQASEDGYECESCERQYFNPDYGSGCQMCDTGSTPNARIAGVFCVPCDLEGTAEAGADRYATADFEACGFQSAICQPGQQLVTGTSDCVDCDTLGDNQYSPEGVRCDACQPGKEPNADRTGCVNCVPGWFSGDGTCRECENGEKTVPFAPFYTKSDHFAKTGSGQTWGKLPK